MSWWVGASPTGKLPSTRPSLIGAPPTWISSRVRWEVLSGSQGIRSQVPGRSAGESSKQYHPSCHVEPRVLYLPKQKPNKQKAQRRREVAGAGQEEERQGEATTWALLLCHGIFQERW